jgi:hypothetical protein
MRKSVTQRTTKATTIARIRRFMFMGGDDCPSQMRLASGNARLSFLSVFAAAIPSRFWRAFL